MSPNQAWMCGLLYDITARIDDTRKCLLERAGPDTRRVGQPPLKCTQVFDEVVSRELGTLEWEQVNLLP